MANGPAYMPTLIENASLWLENNMDSDSTDNIDEKQSSDWQIIPDGNGNLYLNYDAYDEIPIEPAFDAWKDMKFTLHTRNNRNGQQIGLNNAGQLSGSHFNTKHPTR